MVWIAFRAGHRPLGKVKAQTADTAVLTARNIWGDAVAYVRSEVSVTLFPAKYPPVNE